MHRDFSPAHYAEILAQVDVQAVVRCNAPLYNRMGFEAAGIAVVDLCCEDGAPPPIDVIAATVESPRPSHCHSCQACDPTASSWESHRLCSLIWLWMQEVPLFGD